MSQHSLIVDLFITYFSRQFLNRLGGCRALNYSSGMLPKPAWIQNSRIAKNFLIPSIFCNISPAEKHLGTKNILLVFPIQSFLWRIRLSSLQRHIPEDRITRCCFVFKIIIIRQEAPTMKYQGLENDDP